MPKTKTEPHGARLTITDVDDISAPVSFIRNHLSINNSVPAGAPLFAFRSSGSWEALTKSKLLKRCNDIWLAAGLPALPGHAFRIGGCTELLLRGTPPEIVMVLGRWKSKAFLEYWRRIDAILPLFLSNLSNSTRISLLHTTMNAYVRRTSSA